jgi:mannose/cellobiose epimerase-like protein (N-acyl-D-glucosamine 2-epimerase family)
MSLPDLESRAFLQAHVADTLAFYDRHAIDPEGGFFHYLKDDGSVYERSHRHLVSATRLVFTQSMAYLHTAQPLPGAGAPCTGAPGALPPSGGAAGRPVCVDLA